jgi:hypothetical protein
VSSWSLSRVLGEQGLPSDFVQFVTVWYEAVHPVTIREMAHEIEDGSDASVSRTSVEAGDFSLEEARQECEHLLRDRFVSGCLELGEAVEKYVYTRDDLCRPTRPHLDLNHHGICVQMRTGCLQQDVGASQSPVPTVLGSGEP